MDKVGSPLGLIRYSTDNAMKNRLSLRQIRQRRQRAMRLWLNKPYEHETSFRKRSGRMMQASEMPQSPPGGRQIRNEIDR